MCQDLLVQMGVKLLKNMRFVSLFCMEICAVMLTSMQSVVSRVSERVFAQQNLLINIACQGVSAILICLHLIMRNADDSP